MHPIDTEQLSEYLDDTLPAPERAAVEAHLADCSSCRTLLVELGAVVARAGRLEDAPVPELWDGIAGRIAARSGAAGDRGGAAEASVVPLAPRRRRLVVSIPQLAAAAVVLLVVGGAGGWLAAPLLQPAQEVAEIPVPPPGTAAPLTLQNVGSEASDAMDEAVADLELVLAEGRGRLAPSTVATLERNLAVIDAAIGDAQRAVAGDPGNAYLQTHLARIMRRKVDLLRHAAELVAET